jgi:hypothetical protein
MDNMRRQLDFWKKAFNVGLQDMDNVRRQLDFWKKSFQYRLARYGQREKTIELLQQIFLTNFTNLFSIQMTKKIVKRLKKLYYIW